MNNEKLRIRCYKAVFQFSFCWICTDIGSVSNSSQFLLKPPIKSLHHKSRSSVKRHMMQCNVFIKNIMHFIIRSKTDSNLKLSTLHSCGMKDPLRMTTAPMPRVLWSFERLMDALKLWCSLCLMRNNINMIHLHTICSRTSISKPLDGNYAWTILLTGSLCKLKLSHTQQLTTEIKAMLSQCLTSIGFRMSLMATGGSA